MSAFKYLVSAGDDAVSRAGTGGISLERLVYKITCTMLTVLIRRGKVKRGDDWERRGF